MLFLWGARRIGAPVGRGQARAKGVTKRLPRAAKRWARVAKKLEMAAKRHAQNANIGRKMAEDMKKGGNFPPFFGAFVVFQRVAVCDLVAAAALQGMGATGRPSAWRMHAPMA